MSVPGFDDRVGLGTAGAVGGLLAAGLLASINLFLAHILVRAVPAVLALACLLYLWSDRNATTPGSSILPRWSVLALPSVVFLGSTLLIGISILVGGRGPVFYAIAAVLSVLMFVQIAFAADRDLHVGIVLLQVLALGFVVRFAGLLGSAGYVGVDIWIHMPEYVGGILAANSIEGMGQTTYVAAPLYHLLVGATALLADLPARLALFVSLGVGMVLSVLFVYMTARRFVTPRWAAFATMAYNISDFVVVWSIHLIPTSLGLIFFLAILFLFVRIQQRGAIRADVVLVGLFVIAIALTDQVSSFIVLILLLSGSFAQLLLNAESLLERVRSDYRPDPSIRGVHSYTVFALGVFALVWSVTPWGGRSFTEAILEILWGSITGSSLFDRGDDGGATTAAEGSLLAETIIPLLDYTGFLLLLFGAVLGSLYVLRRERTKQAELALIVATVVMMVFTLLPALFGLRSFLPGRWFAPLYAVMVLLSVIGFSRFRHAATPQVFVVVLLVFVLALSGGALFATDATQDAPAFPEENTRYGYTPTEMTAAETIAGITDDEVHTDQPYTAALNGHEDTDRFTIATVPEDGEPDHETVIYREYQTAGTPLFADGDGEQHAESVTADEMCGPNDLAYSNGDVTLCDE